MSLRIETRVRRRGATEAAPLDVYARVKPSQRPSHLRLALASAPADVLDDTASEQLDVDSRRADDANVLHVPSIDRTTLPNAVELRWTLFVLDGAGNVCKKLPSSLSLESSWSSDKQELQKRDFAADDASLVLRDAPHNTLDDTLEHAGRTVSHWLTLKTSAGALTLSEAIRSCPCRMGCQ